MPLVSPLSVDYTLYLVTDSTQELLGNKDLVAVVADAIKGGVTVVQYRDKTSDTRILVDTARRLHGITKSFGIPLLINDRLDVALAIGAEGVHVGQDDMDISSARHLLGPEAIIGVTVSNVQEALSAAGAGASYLGIGTIFSTTTKKNSKAIIGLSGLKDIINALNDSHPNLPIVAIGGIKQSNCQLVGRSIYQSMAPQGGIAVVSAIIAASDPEHSARSLRTGLRLAHGGQDAREDEMLAAVSVHELLEAIVPLASEVCKRNPLSHNMTNLVVQNFAANVAICIGASPIMANNGDEAEDLAKLGGALVVNMGTVTPEGMTNYIKAIKAYKGNLGKVLLDPVGAGATRQRRAGVKNLLDAGTFDIIKGNESEILTLSGKYATESQKGVDSENSGLSSVQKCAMVSELAQRYDTVILMTGATDYLSDGKRTVLIKNGHCYLGLVSGTGCVLGTTISAFIAVHQDVFAATLAAVLLFELAAEDAAAKITVKGPGTFVPAFLDSLYALSHATIEDQRSTFSRSSVFGVPTSRNAQ